MGIARNARYQHLIGLDNLISGQEIIGLNVVFQTPGILDESQSLAFTQGIFVRLATSPLDTACKAFSSSP